MRHFCLDGRGDKIKKKKKTKSVCSSQSSLILFFFLYASEVLINNAKVTVI